MFVGQNISVKGFVTQQKYLSGRSLQQMESLLGYHAGRLSRGAGFAMLDRLPAINEFETFGYSQVAAHRHVVPADLDPAGLRRMAMSAWSLAGPNRLIKVLPATPHDDSMLADVQYRPGEGVPQWKIVHLHGVPGKVVAVLSRHGDVLRLP